MAEKMNLMPERFETTEDYFSYRDEHDLDYSERVILARNRKGKEVGCAYIAHHPHQEDLGGEDQHIRVVYIATRWGEYEKSTERNGVARGGSVYDSREDALAGMYREYSAGRKYETALRLEWTGPRVAALSTAWSSSSKVFLYEDSDHGTGLYLMREDGLSVLSGIERMVGDSTFATDAARMLTEGVDAWGGVEELPPFDLGLDGDEIVEKAVQLTFDEEYSDEERFRPPAHVATYDGTTGKVELHGIPGGAAAAYIGVTANVSDEPVLPEEEKTERRSA